METLNSHEQQRLDEVLRLEIAYSNLSRAFATNNKHKMLSAIGEAFICNQPHIISMKEIKNEGCKKQPSLFLNFGFYKNKYL